jgi:hypothetical protein
MDPNDITLQDVGKLFEYEKHARTIEKMNTEELKIFSKLYIKLYLKQQELLKDLIS